MDKFIIINISKIFNFKGTNNNNICYNCYKKRGFIILLSIIIISIIIRTFICIYYYLDIKRKNNDENKIYNEKNIFNIYNNKTLKQSNNLSNNINNFPKNFNNINNKEKIMYNIENDNASIDNIKNGNIFIRDKNLTNENYDVSFYSNESIKYEITPTSYDVKNCKYTKVKGYYIETENGFPVYIISGGDSYNIDINEVKIEGNNVVIYIKDKYFFSLRVFPVYGFTKIKFNRKPDKITILNYAGQYYLPA